MFDSLRRFIFQPQFVRFLFSRSTSIKHPPKGVNNIRLIGAVDEVLSSHNEQFTAFIMRTYNENNHYEKHEVIVPPFIKCKVPEITAGQRPYVMGKVKVRTFTRDDGRKGSKFEVLVRQYMICDSFMPQTEFNSEKENENNEDDILFDERNAKNIDLNHVDLHAQISFDIINEDEYCSFSLAYRYFEKQLTEEHVDFIPIFVYEKELRNYVRRHLKRLDLVRVQGVIEYKRKMDKHGRKRQVGYISAKRIVKIVPANRIEQKS